MIDLQAVVHLRCKVPGLQVFVPSRPSGSSFLHDLRVSDFNTCLQGYLLHTLNPSQVGCNSSFWQICWAVCALHPKQLWTDSRPALYDFAFCVYSVDLSSRGQVMFFASFMSIILNSFHPLVAPNKINIFQLYKFILICIKCAEDASLSLVNVNFLHPSGLWLVIVTRKTIYNESIYLPRAR